MCQLLGRHLTAQPAPSSSCNGLALLDVDFVLNCLVSRLQAACKQPALILHDDNICVVVVVGMGQPQPRVSRAYTPDGPSWGCLRQLKHLDLASTKTGRHGCRALQALRGHLTSLRLGGPFVDDAACIAVARQGPSLLCLHLHGVLLTARGLEALGLLWGLRELRIQGCAFMDMSARYRLLAALPHLQVWSADSSTFAVQHSIC